MIELNTCYTFSYVPYLTYESFEEYAGEVVADFSPELLETPGILDVNKFIEFYLGMSVEYHRIQYERKILGMIAFDDGFLQVANEETGQPEPFFVKKGTIVIDTSLTTKRNLPRLRFTTMHEGVHWMIHRKAFAKNNSFGSAGVYQNQYLAAKEGRLDCKQPKKERSDIEIIENQADFLAAAILMPINALRNAYREFFKEYAEKPRRIYKGASPADDCYAKRLPEYIAGLFGVSKQAALIRLERLEAIVDNKTWKGIRT